MKNKCKIASMLKKISLSEDISITRGYLHNKRTFCYKIFSLFIVYQGLSFGGFALKVGLVVFVYELIMYLFMKLFFYYLVM